MISGPKGLRDLPAPFLDATTRSWGTGSSCPSDSSLLSLVALVGLGVNAIWHVTWADPVAALLIVPIIVREGWEAMRGKACRCC